MSNLVIENARIIYRNFAGEERQYNPAGRRNFSVVLDEEKAEELMADGWNVKPLKKRDPDDPNELPRFHLPVAVTFGKFPPKVVMIQGKKKVLLDESSISRLDYADLETVDLIIRARPWDAGRSDGPSIKAYLKTGYFTVSIDELEAKYEDFDVDGDMPF